MKYYYNVDVNGFCAENCPISNNLKIGSCRCAECKHNKYYNDDICCIECKYTTKIIRTKKLNSL